MKAHAAPEADRAAGATSTRHARGEVVARPQLRRASATGHVPALSASSVLALQRTIGNRAVRALMRKKTVNIFPVSLGSSTRDPYPDIERAKTIWSQCDVKVNAMIGECSTSKVLDTLDPKDVLNEFSDPASPTTEELAMLALKPGGSGPIHAYYVPRMTAGSLGEAFIPKVNKASAVAVADSALPIVFAHELGHVLLDDGSHHPDPDNLMAAGNVNTGVGNLTPTQCATAAK